VNPVRVRFAPSPSGFLHLGGARTALFNWLFARHHGGLFVLRVDDTNQQRSSEASIDAILSAMRWLGLDWDEGPDVGGGHEPYFQSQRLGTHQDAARTLLDESKAYFCYCTKEEIAARREAAAQAKRPYRYDGRCRELSEDDRAAFEDEGRTKTVRLRIEPGTIAVKDLVLGDVRFESETLDDFIVMKPDFTPVYNFASAIDDDGMRISHVVRGQDHLSNTPRQLLICGALGISPPQFAHIPMVHNARGEKLSKRDGAVSVDEYRELGFVPEAMVNYLVRLAWSADGVEEVFTVAELIEKFDLDRVGRSPSRFDPEKLRWLNARYIARASLSARADAARPFLAAAGYDVDAMPRAKQERIIDAVGDRLHTYAEVLTYAGYFYDADDAYEFDPASLKKWLKTEEAIDTLRSAQDILRDVEPFDVQTLEAAIRAWIDETGAKTIRVLQPIRVAVTGRMVGPGLFDVLDLLGKESVLARLARAIAEVPKTHEPPESQ